MAKWEAKDCEMLIDVALENTQVRYILNDNDVKKFYHKILEELDKETEKTKELRECFD